MIPGTQCTACCCCCWFVFVYAPSEQAKRPPARALSHPVLVCLISCKAGSPISDLLLRQCLFVQQNRATSCRDTFLSWLCFIKINNNNINIKILFDRCRFFPPQQCFNKPTRLMSDWVTRAVDSRRNVVLARNINHGHKWISKIPESITRIFHSCI